MSSSWPILIFFLALCAAAFVYDASNAKGAATPAAGAEVAK